MASVLAVGGSRYFYPRSPCGERQERSQGKRGQIQISIHALLAESDLNIRQIQKIENGISIHALLAESDGILAHHARKIVEFLSTLSLRRATSVHPDTRQAYAISIHALLAESDTFHQRRCIIKHNFYPRSPCGERP